MRLAAVLLLTHPALLLLGTAVRATRYDLVEAALALAALTGAVALGAAIWRRSPGAYWLAVLVAIGWTTAQGLLAIVFAREAAGLPPGEAAFLVAVPLVSALLAVAALLRLLRSPAAQIGASAAAQHGLRIVAAVLAVEGVSLIAVCMFGFAMFSDGEPWYRQALAATQVPGITLLVLLNQCCGLAGGIVLSDVIQPHWGGLLPTGVLIMGFANAVVAAGTVLGVWALLRRYRLARRATPRECAS